MNKKGSIGSVAFVALFAICYFMLGMIVYQFLKVPIDEARTNLTCTTATNWGDKGLCLLVGSVVPLTILSILSIAGGIITDKMMK